MTNGPADYEYCPVCENNRDIGDMSDELHDDEPICQYCADELKQVEMKL